MPTEFDASGYDDLRSYVFNQWNWIGIVDDTGTEQLRWDIQSNSNVTITSDASTNPATVEITVTGQDILDAGGSLPVTLTRTDLFKDSTTSTRRGHDTMSNATLDVSDDQVTITHDYELPSV